MERTYLNVIVDNKTFSQDQEAEFRLMAQRRGGRQIRLTEKGQTDQFCAGVHKADTSFFFPSLAL